MGVLAAEYYLVGWYQVVQENEIVLVAVILKQDLASKYRLDMVLIC